MKMLIFLSKKERSFISSFDKRSFPNRIILFGTLGSNVTLFVSQSASIADLTSFEASESTGQRCCVVDNHLKLPLSN
jgi:hypothetical protein